MLARRFPVAVFGACLAAFLVAGCSGDKIEKARRAIDTEPEVALELLGQARAEKGESFEYFIYTGLTLEKLGRESEAVEMYEKALATEGAAARPEPVAERLLALYEKHHGLAGAEGKLSIARKAAPLEKTLKVARPWASTFLLEGIAADMATAGEAGDADKVRKLAAEGMDLAVPSDAKNRFGESATAAMRQAFVVTAEKKFMESAAGPLGERGVFQADGARMTFYNEFVIPSARSSAEFDTASSSFNVNVRKAACVPLHARIMETVKFLEPVLGLKNVDDAGMSVVFETLFRNVAKAGFKAYGGDRRSPNGQTYLCEIDVPLRDFLSAIFVFAE